MTRSRGAFVSMRLRGDALRLIAASMVIGLATLGGACEEARGAGVLVPRGGLATIEVESHRVEVVIEDGLARTTLRQTFINPHPRVLEALYLFPLPRDAALCGLALEVDGQRLEGLLVERKKAREVYDAIVRERRDPGLVEKIGSESFRLSVYPVAPGKPTVVELQWIEAVPLRDGKYRYVYPLANEGAATEVTGDLTANVVIRSSARLSEVSSETAAMATHLVSPHEARASLEIVKGKLDRDLVVTAQVEQVEPSLSLRVYRDGHGEPYFAATITPPSKDDSPPLPRDVTLLIDESGSMHGDKLEQAKRAATWMLERLRPIDRVQIVLFSDFARGSAEAPMPATPENVAAAKEFVAGATTKGGTNIGAALDEAARPMPMNGDDGDETGGRVALTVLITDGRPTLGITSSAGLIARGTAAREAGSRVYAFGIGADVDTALLEGLAGAGGGEAEAIRATGDVESRLVAFWKRTETPWLDAIDLTIGGRRVAELLPHPLPPVHRGEQLILTGRVAAAGPLDVVVTGRCGQGELRLATRADFGMGDEASFGGDPAARDQFARQRLDWLSRAVRLRSALADDAYYRAIDRGGYSTQDELVAAMIEVSLGSGLQCEYTSFLALLPEDKARLDPRDLAAIEKAARDAVARSRGGNGDPEAANDVAQSGDASPLPSSDAPLGDHGATSDVLAVGGGTVGRGGGGLGGRRAGRGGGRASKKPVDLGLDWLTKHQGEDGTWSSAGFVDRCGTNCCQGAGEPGHDVGATGLATLAFLGAGNTPNTGKYKNPVRKALRALVDAQDPDSGWIGSANAHPEWLLDHAFAVLALSEGFGHSKWPQLMEPAAKGIGFLQARRQPGGGWKQSEASTIADDLMLTGVAVMALRSAKDFGLKVDPAAFDGARAFLDANTDASTWRVGAEATPGEDVETLTAIAMLSRILLGEDPDVSPALRGSGDRLRSRLPKWDVQAGTIDFRYSLFGTFAMYQMGGADWTEWERSLKSALVDPQRKDGDEVGSWDLQHDPWTLRRGRVASTALASLGLQAFYRYDRLIGTR
jgi:Ca-activated chloride channel family protein